MSVADWPNYFAIALAGGALALEIRRWIESGVRLRLSIMADAIEFPDDDGVRKAVLTVQNYGSAPTTLTHFVVFAYKSVFHRVFRKSEVSGIVNATDYDGLPFRLDLAGTWMGRVNYDEKLLRYRNKGQLFVGVLGTHRKRPLLIKVPTEAQSGERVPLELEISDEP